MPYWVICQAHVAGPCTTVEAAQGVIDAVREGVQLPDGSVVPYCSHDHLILQQADKPRLVGCEAEDDEAEVWESELV